MGRIIHLQDDPHRQTQHLLPWYGNGSLDPDEVERVEAHLVECAECRQDLEASRELGFQISRLPIATEHGWEALRKRIAAAPPGSAASPLPFLRRPISVGWALAAQFAAAVLILAVALPAYLAPGKPSYHALGTAPAAQPGNILVMFRPDASERDMRETLVHANARLVGGPTASGAYVLQVEDASRAAALEQLRAAYQIILAEPIDAGRQP